MATAAATGRKIYKGSSDTNLQMVQAYAVGACGDDENWIVTMPADMIGQGWLPQSVTVNIPDNPALAAGARVWAPQDSVGEAGAPVGADLVSYTESTGVLLIANRSGGALTGAVITVMMVAAPLCASM